jgi:NADH dehydrogenase
VVGAGPTGVEMAGQIAELAHRTLKKDFRRINTRNARVILLDAAPQVLPPFGEKLGRKTKKALEDLGVEVQLGAMVVDVDERGLELKDKDGTRRRLEAVTKVWAAGVSASPLGETLAKQTGAALDRAGRISVNPDLTLPGHPEVFVVGDMISLNHLPGVAQVAIQGAKYAAKEIENRLENKPPQAPFKYFDKGSMATISRFSAVAMIGKLRLTGFIAWLMWLAVHLVYITGFKSRITALLHWAVSFIGRGRAERTTTEQQIFARAALQRIEGGASSLVMGPGEFDAQREAREAAQRAELEARAAEEARLTDAGERGTSHEEQPVAR